MSARPEVTGRKYIAKRGVATRYGIVTRTVDRWIAKGVLPKPDLVVNTRAYWDEAALDAHDRKRTVEAGKVTTTDHHATS